ncbi:MAG TPA: thiamine phosphate synthase [Thermoanaerobaculia bacterium]|jgi:thiamine-phosphate pyrophosphorylase|nr:thiamine phosphate synthase [Thermoanaerobaculia bacterium]
MIRERPAPPRIYAIADAAVLAPLPLAEGVAAIAEAGVRWIQLRAKPPGFLSDLDLYRAIEDACRRLEGTPAQLWIDDRADLAALFPVIYGLHLGQTDLPPEAARRTVGDGLAIGLSTHDASQVAAAEADEEVDLIAVGPVFATTSKERPDRVVGLDFVTQARGASAKPLVAIGGITTENVTQVLAAGADSAVVLGAICRGGDARSIRSNAARLLAAAEAA